MKTPVLLALLFLVSPALALEVTGVVYADLEATGRRDPGDPGLEGVRVSNGREIVTTGADGRYTLRICDEGGRIFVLKPRDWRLPADEYRRPRFFQLHHPQGSPARRYSGIPPTGPLPESVDLGLVPASEPDSLRVLAIADPQVTDRRELDYFERLYAAELAGLEGIDFAVVLGDLVNDSLELFEPFDGIMAATGHDWIAVAGNHDLDLDAATDQGARDTFTARYGPANWAFEFGPAHFLVVDSVRFWRSPEGGYSYTGGLGAEQLEFFANYLRALPDSAFVVALMHIPLAGARGREIFRAADRDRLLELLARFDRSLSLAGHAHTNHHLFLGPADGWPGGGSHHLHAVGAASGSWWGGELDARGLPDPVMRDGTPPGYAIVEIRPEGYRIDYRAVGRGPEAQIALHGPGTIMAGTYPNAWLYANVFNGNERTRVDYRIGQGDWRPMEPAAEPDPRLLERTLARARFDGEPTGPRLSPPIDSPHLWKARLSTDLEPGDYRLEVRAIDMFGREFTETTTFRVVPRLETEN